MFAYTNWLRRKKHDKIWCTTYIILYIYIFVDFFFISQSLFDGSPGSRENSNGFNRVTGPQELFVLLRSEQEGHPPNEVRGWGRAEKHPLCCLVHVRGSPWYPYFNLFCLIQKRHVAYIVRSCFVSFSIRSPPSMAPLINEQNQRECHQKIVAKNHDSLFYAGKTR